MDTKGKRVDGMESRKQETNGLNVEAENRFARESGILACALEIVSLPPDLAR